jgi:class 3 adenylate cyclase/esterase/lipase
VSRTSPGRQTIGVDQQSPPIRYAKSGDIHIAYQVVGGGDLDVVFFAGWISHLDLAWEDPLRAAFYRRLASFSRLILFDKRGTGLSERDERSSTMEERMDDVRAVMDAVGSQRAALFGLSEGGPLSMLFAATYPARVRALVLCETLVGGTQDPDFAPGVKARRIFASLHEVVESSWGEGLTLEMFAPSLQRVALSREYMARYERASATPTTAHAHLNWLSDIDVRSVAATLRVPTLVIHRAGDRVIPVDMGRWLAAHIDGARYLEQADENHAPWVGATGELLDAIEEFLTGTQYRPEPSRKLATILFTDIVGSTDTAARLGDRRWAEILDAHHRVVRRELERFHGREIDTAGDGFFATFDGPARAVQCACAIREAVRTTGLEIRAGVHTGEVEVLDDKVAGIAVHIGARVGASAAAGEVFVSRTVTDLVAGSGIKFEDRGEYRLKGTQGSWQLFAVQG